MTQADTPDMVLVPRGTANACLAYLDTLNLLALGTDGQRAREGLRSALSASPLGASGEGALRPASRSSVPTEGHGAAVVGWQPIETAPKDGTEVIVFHPEGGVCAGFCPGEGFAWHVMDGRNTYIGPKSGQSLPSLTSYIQPPTHWMPLPPAPSTTSTAEQVGVREADAPNECATHGEYFGVSCLRCAELYPMAAPNPPGEGDAPVAYGAPHQPWCQPGDQPHRAFRLRFEDPDMREMIWTGPDAEAEALAAYNQYAPTWNVYLFSSHPRTRPTPATPEGLRSICQRIADDYQTSETHHPDHVLIRKEHFDAILSALQPQAQGGE